jgi:hypothetical protein
MPKAPKIMVIRHGEKPTRQIAGVQESGDRSDHDLVVRGWQRAGALSCLFAPARGPLQDPMLATPQYIFASGAMDDPDPGNSRSRRSQETVTPLARLLGIEINVSFSKGEEREVAHAALACPGPVLIAWQHENIRLIGDAIVGEGRVPQTWPSNRFDAVFVFTLIPAEGTYRFGQVMERLLAGDLTDPI